MGAVKDVLAKVAFKIREYTGKDYDECLEIAAPIADRLIKKGTAKLPDGSTITLEDLDSV